MLSEAFPRVLGCQVSAGFQLLETAPFPSPGRTAPVLPTALAPPVCMSISDLAAPVLVPNTVSSLQKRTAERMTKKRNEETGQFTVEEVVQEAGSCSLFPVFPKRSALIQIQLCEAVFSSRKPGGWSSIGRQFRGMKKITSLDQAKFKRFAVLETEIPPVRQVYPQHGLRCFWQTIACGGKRGDLRVWKTCQRQMGGRVCSRP